MQRSCSKKTHLKRWDELEGGETNAEGVLKQKMLETKRGFIRHMKLFYNSLNKYSLSAYNVPDIVINTRNITVNKTDNIRSVSKACNSQCEAGHARYLK